MSYIILKTSHFNAEMLHANRFTKYTDQHWSVYFSLYDHLAAHRSLDVLHNKAFVNLFILCERANTVDIPLTI